MRQNLDHEVRDIYKLDKRSARVWALIRNELSPENVKLFEKYETDMINLGIAKATRIKHLQVLLTISRKLNKNWIDVTKFDIDRLIKEIMNEYGDVNGDETESSRDFKKILKIFFRWFKLGSREHREVGDPPETKGIRLRRPKDKITRENLLTEADLTRLLHACGENLRDRAFIDVHFEAGTRPGEILSLQIKHVEFDKIGAKIHVDGKTGARPIRLIRSTPNLAAWINSHPFRDNPEAPVWILLDAENYGKPMTYVAAKALVERRCRMANLPKRVNLKLFRHTAATTMAKVLTDAEMKKRHGWTKTSNMPARYVHLVDSDVEEKILSHYGISKNEVQIQTNLPRICMICEMPNSPEAMICVKCGKPLDLQTALIKDEEYELQKNELKRISQAVDYLLKEKENTILLKNEIKRQSQIIKLTKIKQG